MGSQNPLNQKDNIIRFQSSRIPPDYCPNSPDTKHEFIQQEYDPEVKRCFWCDLLIVPEGLREFE